MNFIQTANEQAIKIWKRNFASAADFSDYKVGDMVTTHIDNVFPNLRSGEFDAVDVDYTPSNDPILVKIDKHEGILVISDGHHRYAKALRTGQQFITCVIEGVSSHFFPAL